MVLQRTEKRQVGRLLLNNADAIEVCVGSVAHKGINTNHHIGEFGGDYSRTIFAPMLGPDDLNIVISNMSNFKNVKKWYRRSWCIIIGLNFCRVPLMFIFSSWLNRVEI